MSGALFTDLYELTMMAAYHRAGRVDQQATFDLYFRHPPVGVDMVVAAGLELALQYLDQLHFTNADLTYLSSLGQFDDAFLDWLAGLRFTGDVWAIPEGMPAFADEPLLRVDAPLGQAQLVETALLNVISYSSLVTSNASQVVAAANGKPLLEFGARRAHGPNGAITGARAALIGGFAATSNVEAARLYGMPTSGTMAHSFVMAYAEEIDAFRDYARTFPDDAILLVDTYDTLASGVPHAIEVARELAAQGHKLAGIRLDSGDLDHLARRARQMLDDAGFDQARIIASGDLDAEKIAKLEANDPPISGYGVGTSLLTARRDPAFSSVYKLVEIDGTPVLKLSGDPAKTTSPGCKQVWRSDGGDVVGLRDEQRPGEALLVQAMRHGRRLLDPVPVADLHERSREAVGRIRARVVAGEWTVRRSARLEALRTQVLAALRDSFA